MSNNLFDIRHIAADVVNAGKNVQYMELELEGRYDCFVEVLILSVRDKADGSQTIFREPVGTYRDASAELH